LNATRSGHEVLPLDQGDRAAGLVSLSVNEVVFRPRLEDARWEPLFDLLEQTGIIVSFHVTVFPGVSTAFDKYKGSPGATFLHGKMFIEQFLDPFVDLFAWGILERHPKRHCQSKCTPFPIWLSAL
jgi:uncharacterized protein